MSKLGFPKVALALGTIATYTGDTGVASSLLSLAHVLDHAHGSERILVASYGSGSDAFSLLVQEGIVQRREQSPAVPKVRDYLEKKEYVDYLTEPRDVKIGQKVKAVIRVLYEQEGVIRYSYKFQPIT